MTFGVNNTASSLLLSGELCCCCCCWDSFSWILAKILSAKFIVGWNELSSSLLLVSPLDWKYLLNNSASLGSTSASSSSYTISSTSSSSSKSEYSSSSSSSSLSICWFLNDWANEGLFCISSSCSSSSCCSFANCKIFLELEASKNPSPPPLSSSSSSLCLCFFDDFFFCDDDDDDDLGTVLKFPPWDEISFNNGLWRCFVLVSLVVIFPMIFCYIYMYIEVC